MGRWTSVLSDWLFPTRLLTSEDECKWFWHQMIYFPGTINIVSTQSYHHDYKHRYNSLSIFQLCTSTYSVHAGILKLWRGRLPCPLVVFSFHCRSRLPTSFVRSQLTLPVPVMRIRPPSSQNAASIHRVCTHSLLRVQHTDHTQGYVKSAENCDWYWVLPFSGKINVIIQMTALLSSQMIIPMLLSSLIITPSVRKNVIIRPDYDIKSK